MPTRARSELTLPSRGPSETAELVGRLAAVSRPGDVLCLWGDLGAGKTVFAKGFGAGLGVSGTTVASPSFILMAEHRGRLPLFHLDLYRLADAREAIDGGLLDERQEAGASLIEWPERLGSAIPVPRLDVRLEITGESERRITLTPVGDDLDRFLEAAGA
jgi:tRNA threonylcarbamoyladenosine biosynthesis protein TsaE